MAATTDQTLIPSKITLVKYDNPILVTTRSDKLSKESTPPKSKSSTSRIYTTLPPIDARQETIDILNEILPPKEWEKDGKKWIQKVSSTPATRLDVVNLQAQLDIKLKERQAREIGICPVRRELYTQCFDEIIRQVTVNCAERGLLLVRVRDEINMTMAAYRTLYQSSIAFGIRKALQAEQGREDLIANVEELTNRKNELEKLLAESQLKFQQAERRAAEVREAMEKRHEEEVQFLKKANQQLKTQLEGIIAPKK